MDLTNARRSSPAARAASAPRPCAGSLNEKAAICRSFESPLTDSNRRPLLTMVDAELRAGGGKDLRTPARRRADALCELAHRYLDSSERPTVGGERPHVTVTVDVRALRNGHTGGGDCAVSGRCELDHVGAVSPATARRLACDAGVAGGDGRFLRAPGRGTTNPGGLGGLAPGGGAQGPAVRIPCLHQTPRLVRRPARDPLGRKPRGDA